MIAQVQVDTAESLMSKTLAPGSGTVRSVHIYLDMSNHTFTLPNGMNVNTCPAAMGFSFAGGTTPRWDIVKSFITPIPSAAEVACQYPRPILLNTMFKVGNLVMLIIPRELATMAGRRLRNAVRAQPIANGVIDNSRYIVVSGPANMYGHYITTREEYSARDTRMPRRSSGLVLLIECPPVTLEAYIDKYTSLIPFLADSPPGTPASGFVVDCEAEATALLSATCLVRIGPSGAVAYLRPRDGRNAIRNSICSMEFARWLRACNVPLNIILLSSRLNCGNARNGSALYKSTQSTPKACSRDSKGVLEGTPQECFGNSNGVPQWPKSTPAGVLLGTPNEGSRDSLGVF
ncbi:Neutral/alkaline non-lysosomal ceramidase-domain-containing protein [Mycena leptocephala]|nr:Neutral/alkaline non-lysosomal ceramidase-domain-containing protein [Mycena leptocephala]